MKQINFEKAFDASWKLFKDNAAMLIVLYLVYYIIYYLIGNLLGGSTVDTTAVSKAMQNGNYSAMLSAISSGSALSSLISSAVSILFSIGATKLFLNLVRRQISAINQQTVITAFSLSGNVYLKAFLATLLQGLIICVGMIACILPGIFFAARLAFVGELILDDPELGVIDAIGASWKLTEGNTLQMIGIFVVSIIITIIGFVCCLVGVLVAAPLTALLTTVAYIMLKDDVLPATLTEE